MSRQKGDIAEQKAVEFLKKDKFSIIERNFYAKNMGEIDIIAKKDGIYHFIEVKSGVNFEPIYNVTPSKLKKLIKSVNYYLKVKKLNEAYSIDVITIQNDDIELLENITI
jgi:putative endonuclease